MTKRIDSLTPDSIVEVKFHTGYGGALEFEKHTFLRVESKGEERTAIFRSFPKGQFGSFEWSARRYDGRWVHGENAQNISLSRVIGS